MFGNLEHCFKQSINKCGLSSKGIESHFAFHQRNSSSTISVNLVNHLGRSLSHLWYYLWREIGDDVIKERMMKKSSTELNSVFARWAGSGLMCDILTGFCCKPTAVFKNMMGIIHPLLSSMNSTPEKFVQLVKHQRQCSDFDLATLPPVVKRTL